MKRPLASLLKSALLGLLLSGTAHAANGLADFPHDFACGNCHVGDYSPKPFSGVNSGCLKCHNGGVASSTDPTVVPAKQRFVPGDIANPFESTVIPAGQLERRQTSHNWASPSNVPAAGAEVPSAQLTGSLAAPPGLRCAQCHDPHKNANGKFLRIPNTNDALCFDCHRSRNTRNALSGTHPVNFAYTSASSKVKLNPADYFPTPVSANPANPTASVNLPNGMVVCTTCHGVHFTDSNARTVDGVDAARFGQLSTSQGLLLRTDMRAGTANGTNICTNCHTNKKTHNGKGQNIQCADCHAGHVDPGDGTAPNVWLVRRYMNYSGGVKLDGYRKKVFYQYTGVQRNLAGAFGVCQSCHNVPPPGNGYPAEHASTDPEVCLSCHAHNNTTGSFSGGCTSCHGFPPQQNVAGGPDGYARTAGYSYATSGVFKDESLTPHAAHAGKEGYGFTCSQCHAGNRHVNGNFQQVFLAPSGTIAASNGVVPTYATGTGTCLSYCHSNGAPKNTAFAAKAVSWANGKGAIAGTAGECTACHGGVSGSTVTLTTNAHLKHIGVGGAGRGYACDNCHAATALGVNSVINTANHVNGSKDIEFAGMASGSNWSGSTCTTYCHSNGANLAPRVYAAPDWTKPATGACGTCHDVSPHMVTGSNFIGTNGHFAHFSSSASSYGPMLSSSSIGSCQTCHTAFTGEFGGSHVNGMVDVRNSCAPCHNQPGTYSWNGGAVACESCHTGNLSQINGITAPDKSQFKTVGHGQYAGRADQCLKCHARNQRHISADPAVHVTRLGEYESNQNALCAKCHNDANIVPVAARQNMSAHVLDKNDTPTSSQCSSCHDVHGTANLYSIVSEITFKPLSTANITFTNLSSGFVNTTTNRGLCQVCHTKTNHFRRGVQENGHPTKNCLACHDHKGSYAFKPNGNCDSCHGYPPVASMTGLGVENSYIGARPEIFNAGGYVNGGGAHAVPAHVSPKAKPAEAWTNCAVCHSAGNLNPDTHRMIMPLPQKNVTITVDPRYRLRNAPVVYTGPLNGTGTGALTTGTCSNVSCHFQASPVWAP